jgi:hypothetical protein
MGDNYKIAKSSMTLRPDIAEFIADLEMFANRKLNYPLEVGELIQIVIQMGRTGEFEDLIFQAKFLVQSKDLLKRIGSGTQGFQNISREFQSSVQKSADILKILVDGAPIEIVQQFTKVFLFTETESFNRLIKLLSDLSWIKNWKVDGRQLPYEIKSELIIDLQSGTKGMERGEKVSMSLDRIERSALLGVILLVLVLFIDPPVTIFGWILSLGIAAFLVYIILQSHGMTRTPNL